MRTVLLGAWSAMALLIACLPAAAQTRRAVVVGNDAYLPPTAAPILSEQTRARLKSIIGKPSRSGLSRLGGAFNDALEIKKALIARFGFDEKNIVLLPGLDLPATADNILGNIRSHLIEEAMPGDISVFYYAGHGSRIRNVSTENASGLDSTIIPTDALRGTPDIRGKELARLYVEAAKKKVHLTVIQDSCFSGAGARGLFGAGRARAENPDANVSVDEPWSGPLPEDLGVLIMMASEDYQPAMEIPVADFGGDRHGAFTWALLRALYASAPNERADRIFERTRALLQSRVADQEPVLFAKNGRAQLDLFGQPTEGSVHAVAVAVAKVDAGTNVITLNGGQGMSLYKDCVLKRVSLARPPVAIRITEVSGLTSSKAVVDSGDASSVKPGDLFELERWVIPERESLRVFVGPLLPLSDIRSAAAALAPLVKEATIHWVTDPTTETPTHVLSWDGQWRLAENRPGAATSTIEKPEPTTVLRSLVGARAVRLYVRFPLAREVAADLDIGAQSRNPGIAVTDRTEDAHYLLLSRLDENGGVRYGWALPGLTDQDLASQAEEARREQKRPAAVAQPLRSDWSDNAEALKTAALKLARITGWLELEAPPAQEPFPFHLTLRDSATGKAADSELTGGHYYKLGLEADHVKPSEIAPRWVYIFTIDSWGCGTLLSPKSNGNLGNRFPRAASDGGDPASLTVDKEDVIVMPPYSTDTYIMLASGSPIDAPVTVFNFDGVRTRDGGTNPLDRLFLQTGAGTRGKTVAVPADWSIEKLTFHSVPPDTAEAQAAVEKELKMDTPDSCPAPR